MKIAIATFSLLLSLSLPGTAADTAPASAGDVRSKLSDWPQGIQEISIDGARDGVFQPAMFFAPPGPAATPLLVFLHPWGSNHLYATGIAFARRCIRNQWAFIQPEFHGPNNQPKALGSDYVIEDIANAVSYAKTHAHIDDRRIYLVGASGGGHAALLAAGRLPGLFAAVSAWVPITDLLAWYQQTKDSPHSSYARDIVKACGGSPLTSPAKEEAVNRSPLTHLAHAKASIVDINTGIHDGHAGGSVPISHSLLAYNLLAEPADQIPLDTIERMEKDEAIPEDLRFFEIDSSYGKRKVLFRKNSKNVRITITDGKHEIISTAALAWLEAINNAR